MESTKDSKALCLKSCLCLRNIRHFLCFQIPLKVYTRKPLNKRYVAAAADVYHFILDKMVDTRPGSEWFWQTDKYGTPAHKPIVEP